MKMTSNVFREKLAQELDSARLRYRSFIDSCLGEEEGSFRLTPKSESTPYALCFAVFGYKLLCDESKMDACRDDWVSLLLGQLRIVKESREKKYDLLHDKVFLQLLTFTLSALKALGCLKESSINDIVLEFIPKNIDRLLHQERVFDGVPRSGNFAMFWAILLMHGRDYLNLDTQESIDLWEKLHLENINKHGFWGKFKTMSHLQFQNGYHQYEIMEYLDAKDFAWEIAADSVANLADSEGHFAPYVGGGGCYDYDAIFILTSNRESIESHSSLLLKTASTLLLEQNDDGGFCESKSIRPISLNNLKKSLNHILSGRGAARIERIRQAFTLLRPKYNRIQTHWSIYSREWHESDLWDSWFRMLALARIDVALTPENAKNWGFIDYPGIGFHPSLKNK